MSWGGRKSQNLRAWVLANYSSCWICGKPVNKRLKWVKGGRNDNYGTVDHVIPRSKGGTDDKRNLRLAHNLCNNQRNDTRHDEMLPSSQSWV